MSNNQNPQQNPNVRIVPPDFSLKKKIGMNVDIYSIFTPERIAAAQKAIDDSQGEFIGWAQKDLVELEHTCRSLERNIDEASKLRMDKVRKIAFSLKCQSGTFGFNLGSDVAKSLYDYAMKHESFTQDNLLVLRKHIDALQVIFMKNIAGDGGKIGEELMNTLIRLVDKIK